MTGNSTDTRSVIIERDFPHAPEKIWRALTQPEILAEWLMKSDFQAAVSHRFAFTADWGVVDGEVLIVEPNRSLSYTWAAMGIETVVTWTLTPIASGTHVRMEQSGFGAGNERAYQGAQYGWQNFFGALEQSVARLD